MKKIRVKMKIELVINVFGCSYENFQMRLKFEGVIMEGSRNHKLKLWADIKSMHKCVK